MENMDKENNTKATLMWRKIPGKREMMFILVGWENVMRKEDLPAVYTRYGPHFWEESSWEEGDSIHIGGHIYHDLYVGMAFNRVKYDKLYHYLDMACIRLKELKYALNESERIVWNLGPSQDFPITRTEEFDFDEKEVNVEESAYHKRLTRAIHGLNKFCL